MFVKAQYLFFVLLVAVGCTKPQEFRSHCWAGSNHENREWQVECWAPALQPESEERLKLDANPAEDQSALVAADRRRTTLPPLVATCAFSAKGTFKLQQKGSRFTRRGDWNFDKNQNRLLLRLDNMAANEAICLRLQDFNRTAENMDSGVDAYTNVRYAITARDAEANWWRFSFKGSAPGTNAP